jgi:hypothetical protein
MSVAITDSYRVNLVKLRVSGSMAKGGAGFRFGVWARLVRVMHSECWTQVIIR